MAEKQDIAMNAFQIVTDAEYIYAETANGSQVKIKKSDLLGALFQSRGEVPSKGYNYCSKSGVYDIVKGVSLPDEPTYGVEYGVLMIFITRSGHLGQNGHNLKHYLSCTLYI